MHSMKKTKIIDQNLSFKIHPQILSRYQFYHFAVLSRSHFTIIANIEHGANLGKRILAEVWVVIFTTENTEGTEKDRTQTALIDAVKATL